MIWIYVGQCCYFLYLGYVGYFILIRTGDKQEMAPPRMGGAREMLLMLVVTLKPSTRTAVPIEIYTNSTGTAVALSGRRVLVRVCAGSADSDADLSRGSSGPMQAYPVPSATPSTRKRHYQRCWR